MRVPRALRGEETLDERQEHSPEQIIKKLREADAMIAGGKSARFARARARRRAEHKDHMWA
jgi:hypothetical protein